MVCRLIDFAFVVLELLTLKVCGIMCILKSSFSIFLVMKGLRDHNGNKLYNLLFLCNPTHQLSAIKDIVSYSLVFYC